MTPAERRRPAARAFPFALSASALALSLALPALAQTAAPQRVEITGSAIKRIDGETALPVQVITREEIDKTGVTTAAELISRLSATAANLTDGGSVAYGGFRDQMGFNGANLRGLGVSSTLVLLNGRRMANFASPGDAAGVDLNAIPAAAIERVEVLLDGASSLYGSDAIGGVINFITRKDFNGLELRAQVGNTTEGGGGNKRSVTLAGGLGDLGRDGYNLMAVADLQKTSKLNALNRRFISDLQIPQRLPDLLSSATFPGNLVLSSSQRDTLASDGWKPNGVDLISTKRANPSAATGCNPPANLYLPEGIGGVDGCTFDYMRDIELYPESTKSSVFGRGVLDLGGGHQGFAEVSLARARTLYSGTPNRIDADIDVGKIPFLAFSSLNALAADDEDRIITVRTRLVDAGLRTSELVSTTQRVLAGTNGVLAGWDYEWAVNHSTSKVSDRDYQGYLNEQTIRDGFADGTLNPFGTQTAAGLAMFEAAQIRGEVRRATGAMTSLDVKASRGLMKLDGGDLAVAVGSEFRREKQDYHQSQALADDLILGETSQGPGADFGRSRKVAAVFGEVSAPITRQLELTGAMRYEKYQVSGGALSPKLGMKFVPMSELLLRASVGKGFRAPSMTDLYRPVTEGSSATLVDPLCMQLDPDATPTDCSDIWTTLNYSNPKLKPEKSRQFSLGGVFEPRRGLSVSVDYWNIQKSDLISTLGVDVILGNLAKYGSLVHRDSDQVIEAIDLIKQNRGKQKISGIDLGVAVTRIKSPIGELGVSLNGTLTLQSKSQTGDGDPYVSNLGRFINDGVVQRWRHTLAVDWSQGAFSASLSNNYLSGYQDQAIVGKPDRRVSEYSLWNLSGAWEFNNALTLRAGVRNLFDTAPPFSQQAYFFISGYDPSYTDPRGRFVYLSAQYKFK
ncbi:TonB-dependent receptor [Ideonella sp. 4Y16]|uniref:TonB-dependent receptor n=1 Tax=Ideonella alba TaxID=2824118 RepID=A0A940Y5V7_9BURK|nr:TonB-dependent receptor [Ideonella alba]MBQ0929271.1 TonB-dependent receptor [Ideonella alba]MBQ0945382.1 TonB-dependent receptor [Ideonella alba]